MGGLTYSSRFLISLNNSQDIAMSLWQQWAGAKQWLGPLQLGHAPISTSTFYSFYVTWLALWTCTWNPWKSLCSPFLPQIRAPQPQFSPLPVFVNKVHWTTVMLVHLLVSVSAFTSQRQSLERQRLVATRIGDQQIIYYLAYYRKNLSTPALCHLVSIIPLVNHNPTSG